MLQALPGVEVTFSEADNASLPGSGRKAMRNWSRRQPCCHRPRIHQLSDGRFSCAGCGTWYSASHSGTVLGCARSTRPVGIDVQVDCHRPAAMRRLGRICGISQGTIRHWSVVEAVVKAQGRAGAVPTPKSYLLPEIIPDGTIGLPGASVTVATSTWREASVAIAVLDVLDATEDPGDKQPGYGQESQ